MKKIAFIFLTPLVTSCVKDSCIDEAIKEDNKTSGCNLEYDPVCGCDKKTYSNSCDAYVAGVTSYKEGKCK